MKALGFSMCLDDFGAGAASFQYLRALDVDYVKIDGTYTRRLLSSERDSLLLRKLCDLCADLKIETIAEMVELEDQVDKLRSLGVKRSEEHTSELQSLMRISYAVFCLKKKKTRTKKHTR